MQQDSEDIIGEEDDDQEDDNDEDEVVYAVVTNVDIPFTSLVFFLVKLSLASIPATIILTIVFIALVLVVGLIASALGIVLGPRF